MCKSSHDSKDYFFSLLFLSVPLSFCEFGAAHFGSIFFSPQICCPKILDVLDLKLSDSWHYVFFFFKETCKNVQ